MTRSERQAAHTQFLAFCAQGYSWSAAAHAVGLTLSRTTACRLRQRANSAGGAAPDDRRQGHAYKVSPAIRTWLYEYCQQQPSAPTRQVQAALLEQQGVRLSVTHLNRLRAALAIRTVRRPRVKKD